MFDRSQILRSAWSMYRIARPAFFAAGDTGSKRVFLRTLFAKFLRRAWEEAKKLAKTVVAFVAAEDRVLTQKIAAMDPMARSARIVAIREELTVLDYAP
jgi:hypothetical protein